MANPAKYASPAHMRNVKVHPAGGVWMRDAPRLQPDRSGQHRHPLPQYLLWRSLIGSDKFKYNQGSVSRYGEGEGMRTYHQYFAHAKDPADSCRTGREYELLRIHRGLPWKKALPKAQYTGSDPKATVRWLFKSWDDALDQTQMWQREVWHDAHVPTHLGAKRPLSVLAPSTYHKQMTLVNMNRIDITICPFLFGFGHTMQKTVLDFYRRCLSGRAQVPNDKVHLSYTATYTSPRVTVEWKDGSKWSPPLVEGSKTQDLIQAIMEQAWLQADRMEAAGVQLPPLTLDDFKWAQVVQYKKKKSADPKAKKK